MEENGLLFAYLLDGNGCGKRLDWEDIKKWSPDDGALWMHFDYGAEGARAWLDGESGLDPVNCEALTEEDTRPRLLINGKGLLFILRAVNNNPGHDPEDMVSLRMWFEEKRVITMRHRRVTAASDIHRELKAGRGPCDVPDFLVTVIDRVTDRIGDVVSDIDDNMDQLEDTVLTAESYSLRSALSILRRKAIGIRRYIAPQRDIIMRLQNERIPWLSDVDKVNIREDAERTTRYVEDLDSVRDRAAVTHEELNSRLSDQMNRTMYLLSIVAAVFLPLSLITGLLGINVGGIPGADSRWGFAIVCGMLGFLVVGQILLYRRLRLF